MSITDEIKHRVDQFKHEWKISRGCCDIEDFSDEVLLLIKENKRHEEAWEVLAHMPMSMHPSEVREFALQMLKGKKPYDIED